MKIRPTKDNVPEMPARRRFLELTTFSALAASAPRVLAGNGAASAWSFVETTREGARMRPGIASAALADASTLSCDATERHQQIIGFGGALTESSAYVLSRLSAAQRREVLRRYYDPHDGIGYTLARTHIGSCDFSLSTWSLDDTPGDYELLNFSLAPMRKLLLPLLLDAQRAVGSQGLRVVASPWSPPAWMKTNNRMDGGGSLREEYAAAWANYYIRFLAAMRDEGMPIWGLTVQNEPEAIQPWESCTYTPEQERDFVAKHLGPALKRSGNSSVKLFGWDHNRDAIEKRADAMLGDANTAQFLSGLAVHWYVSDDYAASARVLAKYPDKQILFTEGCVEGGAKPGDWNIAERYARNIMGDLSNGVSGWIDWNIALDMRGGPNHVGNFCDAPVLVDIAQSQVIYQSSFYAIAHFSRYVKPGAHRIALRGDLPGVHSIAFINVDGSIVVVAFNATDVPISFNLACEGHRCATRITGHALQTYVLQRSTA